MAGRTGSAFEEKLSPFLRDRYQRAGRDRSAPDDTARVIALQYLAQPGESVHRPGETSRHFHAEVRAVLDEQPLPGLERLYRRTLVIEPTTVCAAHCRWCLRANYDVRNLSDDELLAIARYCGESPETADVREVLITGGDPLMVPAKLTRLLDALQRHAPRIEVFRIGTRVPVQDPARVNADLLERLRPHAGRIELGVHVNHPAELLPEATDALQALRALGIVIYDQTVLLKGLNDSADVLLALLERLRELRVEMHYLFHCAPIAGMSHHRTSVERGLLLAGEISSSGRISGRAKPRFALLTDVGKVTLYEGSLLARDGERLLIQTHYRLEERREFNPAWSLPASAEVDETGRMRVWYLDGPAS